MKYLKFKSVSKITHLYEHSIPFDYLIQQGHISKDMSPDEVIEWFEENKNRFFDKLKHNEILLDLFTADSEPSQTYHRVEQQLLPNVEYRYHRMNSDFESVLSDIESELGFNPFDWRTLIKLCKRDFCFSTFLLNIRQFKKAMNIKWERFEPDKYAEWALVGEIVEFINAQDAKLLLEAANSRKHKDGKIYRFILYPTTAPF